MGVFDYFTSGASESVAVPPGENRVVAESTSIAKVTTILPTNPSPNTNQPNSNPIAVESTTISTQTLGMTSVDTLSTTAEARVRRLSFRPFGLMRKNTSEPKPILSAVHEHEMREHANEAAAKRQKVQLSNSDKRAQVSALAVRALIIGPTSSAEPKTTPAIARPQLSKIKSQLMEPKSANKVIAQLRQLPATGELSLNSGHSNGPIHAVCLAYTDVEEHNLHFSKLTPPDIQREVSVQDTRFPGIVSAPLDALAGLFNEMHVVDLITSPDFGLGQPGNGEGLLAGAVPTAETVINGVKQITPQLMALGYATGQAIKPDHSGIYPPTDRMSVLTYWWGLEVLLPPPSLVYLSNAQSISGAVMNFLSALSLINNGVREILPFIRYISQFIDFEFSAIKKQDKGQGVVCAATWIMPAAMVPRPWDFPTQPPAPDNANEKPDPQTGSMGPAPIVSPPSDLPKPVYSVIDTVVSPADKPVSRPSAQPDTSPTVN